MHILTARAADSAERTVTMPRRRCMVVVGGSATNRTSLAAPPCISQTSLQLADRLCYVLALETYSSWCALVCAAQSKAAVRLTQELGHFLEKLRIRQHQSAPSLAQGTAAPASSAREAAEAAVC